MKKLLAILLALMMVLVSVAAFAAGEDGDTPAEETPAQTEDNSNGNEDGGESGNTTSTTPIATTNPTAVKPSVEEELPATAPVDVTIYKHFNISGTGAKLPAQTVTFTPGTGVVTMSTTVNTAPSINPFSVDFTETDVAENLKKAVKISLPSFPGVGIYTYPLTETDTNIAGQFYASNLELKVTVIQGDNGLQIGGVALRQNNIKTDTLENDYKAHDLTVGKTVTGNMGDTARFFPITVELTAPANDSVYGSIGVTINGTGATVKDGETPITTSIAAEEGGWTSKTLSLSLKSGQTVKFDNLPEGVTYKVTEGSEIKRQAGTSPTEAEQADKDTYKVTGEVDTTELKADGASVTIINNKEIEIDTGVALDSTVYMLIMALALAGFVVLKIRRREEN